MKKKVQSISTSNEVITTSLDTLNTMFCKFYNTDEVDAKVKFICNEIIDVKNKIVEVDAKMLDKEMNLRKYIRTLELHLEEQQAKFNYFVRYGTVEPVLVYDKKAKSLYLHRLVNCHDVVYYVSSKRGKIIEENDTEIIIKTKHAVTRISKF